MPLGLRKTDQDSLPLGMVLAELAGSGNIGFRSKALQFSVCLPVVSLVKEHTEGPSWEELTVHSADSSLAGGGTSIWRTRLVG